jgi:hypothetical protein
MIEAIQRPTEKSDSRYPRSQWRNLLHGIYRARTPEVSQRRREFIDELVRLVPLHPITLRTAYSKSPQV